MQEAGSGCHTLLGCRGCPRRQCDQKFGGTHSLLRHILSLLSEKKINLRPRGL